MKRIPEPRSQSLPSAKLYRDDLEEILEVLRSGDKDARIYSGTFQFESLDEAAERLGNTLRDLRLDRLGVSLELRPLDIGSMLRLYSSGEDPDDAAFHRIREIVMRRRRFVARILTPSSATVVIVAALLLAIMLRRLAPGALVSTLNWVGTGVGWCLAFLLQASFAFRTGFLSVAHLKLRHETTTAWSRNRDQLVTSIIAGAIGSILTVVAQWLWHQLTR